MQEIYQDKKKISNRLRRIEGQIRGIEKLVDQDVEMIKILTQIKAVKSALHSVVWILLNQQLDSEKHNSAEEHLIDLKKNITHICKLLD